MALLMDVGMGMGAEVAMEVETTTGMRLGMAMGRGVMDRDGYIDCGGDGQEILMEMDGNEEAQHVSWH